MTKKKLEFKRGSVYFLSQLKTLLLEEEMAFSGRAEDYMLLLEGDKVVGCFKYVSTAIGFHLEVIVISEERRGERLGGLVLEWLIARKKSITVLTQNSMSDFYKRYGFIITRHSLIPRKYVRQCAKCIYKRECIPRAMIYLARRGG